MAQPTPNQVHVDRALTDVSIAYSNAEFIGTQIFPFVQVNSQTDEYFIYTKGDWFRDEATQRAPGNAPNVGGYGISTCPFVCINYAHRSEVPIETRDNADDPIQPATEAVEYSTEKIELALERRIAGMVTTSCTWGTSACPTTQWDTDTSDPISDISTGIAAVRDSIGKRPNVIVIGAAVWDALVKHPDVVARVVPTQTLGIMQPGQLGAMFNVPKVLVGEAIYNSAAEGITESMSNIWGEQLWIGYVVDRPTIRTATAGKVFRWKNRMVESHEIPDEYKTVYDAQEWTDEVRTATDAGYLIEDILA